MEGPEATRVLSDLCWEYRFENVDSALHYGNSAIQYATEQEDKKGQAQAYNDLAIIYIITSQFNEADSLLRIALELETERNDTVRIGAILNKLGIIAQKRGLLQAALSYDLEGLKYFESLGDIKSQAMLLNNIAIIHNNLGEYDLAKRVLRKVYNLKMSIKDSNEAAGTLVNMGNAFLAVDELDSSEYFFLKSEEMLLACDGSPEYLAGVYNSLGAIYQLRDEFDRAEESFTKALEFRSSIRDIHSVALSLFRMGELNLLKGDLNKAKYYLDSAHAYAVEAQAGTELFDIYLLYSKYYSVANNAALSFEYGQRAIAIKDSLLGAESRRAIAEYEALFETEKKERRIAELDAAKAQISLDNAQQRVWIITLVGLILILSLGSWLLYSRRQQRVREEMANQQLEFNKRLLDSTVIAQEEERQRIAKDLHDGLVQQLAVIKMGLQSFGRKLKLEPSNQEEYAEKIKLVDNAADDARSLSHQMMPRALMESGLLSAMEDMLSKSLTINDLEYEFEHFGLGEGRLKQVVEIGLYRIAQEMINNIIKHSGAKQVFVQLYKTKTHLVLHVEDDGKGFTPDDSSSGDGIGMSNIYSRASSVNGRVSYEKGTPGGTVANVRIPLD